MTERKPPSMSYASWIDLQIADAEKRGVFDNLPGAGKPLPGRGSGDYAQAWLRDYLRREGIPAEELLPPPLRLRRQAELLAGAVPLLRSEREVRHEVRELRRIMDWRRISLGPPIHVPLVDEEQMAGRWRDTHPAGPAAPPAPRPPAPAAAALAGAGHRPRRRWWRGRRGLPRGCVPAAAPGSAAPGPADPRPRRPGLRAPGRARSVQAHRGCAGNRAGRG